MNIFKAILLVAGTAAFGVVFTFVALVTLSPASAIIVGFVSVLATIFVLIAFLLPGKDGEVDDRVANMMLVGGIGIVVSLAFMYVLEGGTAPNNEPLAEASAGEVSDDVVASSSAPADQQQDHDTVAVVEAEATCGYDYAGAGSNASFDVEDTILEAPGYELVWPDEEACLEFNLQVYAQIEDGVEVWHRFETREGDIIIYNSTGVRTSEGEFLGCSGGWFVNYDNVQHWYELKNGEAKVISASNPDMVAVELTKFISANNQCPQSYLGEIPLH